MIQNLIDTRALSTLETLATNSDLRRTIFQKAMDLDDVELFLLFQPKSFCKVWGDKIRKHVLMTGLSYDMSTNVRRNTLLAMSLEELIVALRNNPLIFNTLAHGNDGTKILTKVIRYLLEKRQWDLLDRFVQLAHDTLTVHDPMPVLPAKLFRWLQKIRHMEGVGWLLQHVVRQQKEKGEFRYVWEPQLQQKWLEEAHANTALSSLLQQFGL